MSYLDDIISTVLEDAEVIDFDSLDSYSIDVKERKKTIEKIRKLIDGNDVSWLQGYYEQQEKVKRE